MKPKTKKIMELLETIKYYLNKDKIDNVDILIAELQQRIKEYKKNK